MVLVFYTHASLPLTKRSPIQLPQIVSFPSLATPSDALSVPRRSARSFISAKKTGTRIKTWIVEVIIPPTRGPAIGFITSEPTPVSHRIGTRLARTRSEEHTLNSSHLGISYAVFCLKKKK